MLTLSSPHEHHPGFMTAPSLSPAASLQLQDIIVAPATPAGPGARAILRLSGPGSWDVVRPLLINNNDRFNPHSTLPAGGEGLGRGSRHDAQLRLPEFFSSIPVHLQMWPGPRTYTGQDLIEIHLISSPPIVQALLDHLIERGARLAQPGEFTLRAFLAGKLDLTQAEAVLALTTSSDPLELRTALAQLAGGLGRPLDILREELLALLAEVEAGLDFADEDLTFIENTVLVQRIHAAHSALAQVRDQLQLRGQARPSFRVVLAGPTNVGKSSLFNALLGRSAALVSPTPGTTRDYLTGTLNVQGVGIELVDTAGREEVYDLISRHAQNARGEQVQQADLILLCFDAENGLPCEEEQLMATMPGHRVLLVATKADLSSKPLGHAAIMTSTLTGAGLATLRLALAERARAAHRGSALAPSLTRCQGHIDRGLSSLEQAASLALDGSRMELVATELRSALDSIGAMVGAVYTDDLLDRVFSQFCIGK